MASDKVKDDRYEKALRSRVEFWASTMDAFLQEYVSKCVGGDGLGTIVATARLAQLGACIGEEFQSICNALISSDTENKVANQGAVLTLKMVNDNGESIYLMKNGESAPDAVPDRSLS